MSAEQQSLSAELSQPQTDRPSSHGHTASLRCCRQRILLVEGSEQGIAVQLEQPSGTIRNILFQVSSNSSNFHSSGEKEGENGKLYISLLLT